MRKYLFKNSYVHFTLYIFTINIYFQNEMSASFLRNTSHR